MMRALVRPTGSGTLLIASLLTLTLCGGRAEATVIGVVAGNGGNVGYTNAPVEDWNLQNPAANTLNGVVLVGPNHAWAVGNNGVVWHTSNASNPVGSGGPTWTQQTNFVNTSNVPVAAPTNALQSVDFVNTSNGWAVGDSGRILSTTNGGATWVSRQVAGTGGANRNLNGVDFVNSTTGWAVGNEETVLKTTDGGASWTLQAGATTVLGGTPNFIAVSFVSASTGWLVTSTGDILRTGDGGTTWQMQTSKPGGVASLRSVYFVNSLVGYAIGAGTDVIKTTDGGVNWVLANTGIPGSPSLMDIFFLNATTGWVVGDSGKIFKTTNGGGLWVEIDDIGTPQLQSISLFDTESTSIPEPGTAAMLSIATLVGLVRVVSRRRRESQPEPPTDVA